MYVYLEPQGGINDCLSTIWSVMNYCKKFSRILLVNGNRTEYKVNFSDYFYLPSKRIIFDTNEIREIFKSQKLTVHPDYFNEKLLDILDGKYNFDYQLDTIYKCDGIKLDLPTTNVDKNVIIHSRCGWGLNGFSMLKELHFTDNAIAECNKKYSKLKKPYLCIQIRNTDMQCKFRVLLQKNRKMIKTYKDVYVATDDKNTLKYVRLMNRNAKNFTKFPDSAYFNLHNSNIDGDTKFSDLLADMYIAGLAQKILSNSQGGFIALLRSINDNKSKCKHFLKV